MSRRQLHVGPDTLPGLTVHLKLSNDKKIDLFRWLEKSDHTYMTDYATAVFEKHIREKRKAENDEKQGG